MLFDLHQVEIIEIHSSRGGAGGEAPLTGSGVSPETFSFLLLASVGGSYEWMSGDQNALEGEDCGSINSSSRASS